MEVSILVLMDSSFQLKKQGPRLNAKKVSILVLMDSSFQSAGTAGQDEDNDVSILVLMDSSFQLKYSRLPVKYYQCFNPCFNGFFFSIRNCSDVELTYHKFQSLF